jgi:hypothetical protein
MTLLKRTAVSIVAAVAVFRSAPTADAAAPRDVAAAICSNLFSAVFGVPTGEPLASCQWDMALIRATSDVHRVATGRGVTIGVIDSGVDFHHPDIAPNLDVERSCSFITSTTPLASPQEIGNGDCSNKAAVQDLFGHGTHVASIIAAPRNGIGIAGVAPHATIVALKACIVVNLCFADDVAAALRYAGTRRSSVMAWSTRRPRFVDIGARHAMPS